MSHLLPPADCYTGEEVARILRVPLQKFYRLRKTLERNGMPEAIRCGKELRYSKVAFNHWFNSPRRDTPPQDSEEPEAIASWSKRLLQVYGQKR